MTQHSVVGWLGRERKCHARDARQLDPSCVEQALIALRDVAPTVWKRFRAEPLMPGFHTQKEEKHLAPEQQERQKQLDADYKAATNKVPDQKANDPWASVRQTPTVPAPKKKQQ